MRIRILISMTRTQPLVVTSLLPSAQGRCGEPPGRGVIRDGLLKPVLCDSGVALVETIYGASDAFLVGACGLRVTDGDDSEAAIDVEKAIDVEAHGRGG